MENYTSEVFENNQFSSFTKHGIFGQQMVMHVEAFGMTTTEQASKYSKEEWWVSIRVGWFDSLLEDAMERISTRAPAARKCNGVYANQDVTDQKLKKAEPHRKEAVAISLLRSPNDILLTTSVSYRRRAHWVEFTYPRCALYIHL
jgi:hypothetical protein